MTFAEVHVQETIGDLNRLLRSQYFASVLNERTSLHRECTHLKVPGCSFVLSALLTKKLPMFLLLLNEISGGCKKILPVSGSF